jgi:hypothetical protein
VIYRSVGPDNAKNRPPYHDKRSSLLSLLRALEAVDRGDVTFLNGGPMPEDRLALMRSAGRIEPRGARHMHESYWEALALAVRLPDEDLALFAEDDHLYRADALAALLDAARALPGVDYFAPYGSTVTAMPNGEPLHPGLRVPRVREEVLAPGWCRGVSHTSSFAVRVGALRRDVRLHRVAPRCGGAWDHALGLAYQGLLPYGAGGLLEPLRLPGLAPSRRAKVVIWRGLLSALAFTRRSSRRLAVARPPLSTHAETGVIALGTDWAAEVAALTTRA